MDVFVIEGCKAIFRLALSLLMLIPKKDLKVSIELLAIPFFHPFSPANGSRVHCFHHGKVTASDRLQVVVE